MKRSPSPAIAARRRCRTRALTALLAALIAIGLPLPARADEAAARNDPLDELRAPLKRGVETGAFPGCVVAIGSSEGPLFIEGFGTLLPSGFTSAPGTEARPDASTLWDLASLTKIVSTTTLALILVDSGKLSLETRVASILPELLERAPSEEDRARRELLRVEHLLTHSGGLAAWRPLHERVASYPELLDAVLATPFDATPGEKAAYSDLGFILLGATLERVGGRPLAELERELVFKRLAMGETTRRVAPLDLARTAPTELDPTRDELIHGVVHDENSRAAGGLTGHAGLFSSAGDLARFATVWLRARCGLESPLPHALAREFTRRRELVADSSRALGWDTPSGRSSAGTLFSRSSFGHTGFTGTSVWIDPERDLFVVLLSNRVCPSRRSSGIAEVRREIADAAARHVDRQRKEALDATEPPEGTRDGR